MALKRGQVSPLCLILHELATNAVNYAIGRLVRSVASNIGNEER